MVSPPTRSGNNALEVLLLEGLSIPTLTARDAGRRGDHGRQGAAAQGTVTAGMAAANVAATGIKGYRSQVAAMAKRTADPTMTARAHGRLPPGGLTIVCSQAGGRWTCTRRRWGSGGARRAKIPGMPLVDRSERRTDLPGPLARRFVGCGWKDARRSRSPRRWPPRR